MGEAELLKLLLWFVAMLLLVGVVWYAIKKGNGVDVSLGGPRIGLRFKSKPSPRRQPRGRNRDGEEGGGESPRRRGS